MTGPFSETGEEPVSNLMSIIEKNKDSSHIITISPYRQSTFNLLLLASVRGKISGEQEMHDGV